MYGIEYYTQANLINEQDEAKSNLSKVNDKAVAQMSENTAHKLAAKLHTLATCPDYLLPKAVYSPPAHVQSTTAQAGTAATTTNHSIKSQMSETSSINSTGSSYYTDDFILLTEFSEIEGPKPLLTIPTDGGTAFNKNEYSLHLMCVDFHSHLKPTPPGEPSAVALNAQSKFSLTKDTSIINYWDSSTSVAACVHHFTLYDLEARGFVRPFCLAYVSYDQSKPVVFFEKLREKFAQITDLFKRSNFNLFKRELEQRCSDLGFTRDLFAKWSATGQNRKLLAKEFELDFVTCVRLTSASSSDEKKCLQLKSIESLRNELENVLATINTELSVKQWFIAAYNMQNSVQDMNGVDHVESNGPTTRTNRSMTYPPFESNPKTVENVGLKKTSTLRRPRVFKNILIGNYNKSLAYDEDFEVNERTGDEVAQGVDFHHLNQGERKIMKRLHQLSIHTAKEAINELRVMLQYFSTPYYLLKYRDLNRNGAEPLMNGRPNHFWSITAGDCVVGDFSTRIDTLNLNKYSLIKKFNSSSRMSTYSQLYPDCVDKKARLLLNANKPADQTRTNKVANNSTSSGKTQFFSPDQNSSAKCSLVGNINNDDEAGNEYENSEAPVSWENLEHIFYDAVDEEKNDEPPTADKEESTNEFYETNSIEDNYYDETNEFFKEENEYDFVNSLMDYKRFAGPPLVAATVYSGVNQCRYQPNVTDNLIQMIEFNFEETLRKLSSQCATFFPHLLYSLLKGKPVVCITRYCDDSAYLKSVIECLSNFVPNSFHVLNEFGTKQPKKPPQFSSSPCNQNSKCAKQELSATQPLLKTIFERQPIRLNDLKHCKLIGLNLLICKDDASCCSPDCNSGLLNNANKRTHFYKHQHRHFHSNHKCQDEDSDLLLKFIPITIRNYVSILDLDKGTFMGPKYEGTHLNGCWKSCQSLKQDSICYLYLLSHVVKYYMRIAFIYNYSILFDENNTESRPKTQPANSRLVSQSSTKTEMSEASNSVSSLNLKRERVIRFFSLSNASCLNESRPPQFMPSMNSSLSSSINSLAASWISNDTKHAGRKLSVQSMPVVNDDLESLKIVLAVVNSAHLALKSSHNFTQSDFNIVNNILKTLQLKQVYLYNWAMRKRECKEKSCDESLLSMRIPFPLLVEYEEMVLFHSKK